jgi:hypothetical protein
MDVGLSLGRPRPLFSVWFIAFAINTLYRKRRAGARVNASPAALTTPNYRGVAAMAEHVSSTRRTILAGRRVMTARPGQHPDNKLLALGQKFDEHWALANKKGLADEEREGLADDVYRVAVAIRKVPATSLAGLTVQARVALTMRDHRDEELVSLLQGIERLAGPQAA